MKFALIIVLFRLSLAVRINPSSLIDNKNPDDYSLFVTVPDGSTVVLNVSLPQKSLCQPARGKTGFILVGTPYGTYKNSSNPLATFADSQTTLWQLALWVSGTLLPSNESGCPALVMYEEQGTWISQQVTESMSNSDASTFDLWQHSTANQEAIVKKVNSQSWSNGVAIPDGISAMGIRSYLAGNIAAEASIRAQFAMWASPHTRTAGFTNGVFNTGVVQSIAPMMSLNTEEVCQLAAKHEDPGTPFWEANSFSDWPAVSWPAHMVAGWSDIFIEGQMEAWYGYRKSSQANVRDLHTLMVGPLGHCILGGFKPDMAPLNKEAIVWQLATSVGIIRSRLVSTFAQAASDSDFAEALSKWAAFIKPYPRIVLYVYSGKGDYLTGLDDMPVYTPEPFYFRSGHSNNLSSAAPSEGTVSFLFDPSNPVSAYGGRFFGGDPLTPCGPLNQRSVRMNNSDKLLFFTSSVFSEPYAITGPVVASLVVGSNATDTDFSVKLVDVRPSGEEYLVTSGIARMAYRDGDSKKPIAPGKNHINITMAYASWIFEPGSKLGVILTSSEAYGYRVNPNTGAPLIIPETGTIFPQTGQTNVTAENTLYFGLSSIVLPKVDVADLPELSPTQLHLDDDVKLLEAYLMPKLKDMVASKIRSTVTHVTTEAKHVFHGVESWISGLVGDL